MARYRERLKEINPTYFQDKNRENRKFQYSVEGEKARRKRLDAERERLKGYVITPEKRKEYDRNDVEKHGQSRQMRYYYRKKAAGWKRLHSVWRIDSQA